MKQICLIFLLLSLSGCYYDNGETLYPRLNDTCDVSNVTWLVTVKPILTSGWLGCQSSVSAASSGGGIRLESYTDVKTVVNNQKLYGSISHSSGYSPMPKGGNKLSSCNLQQIKKWIDNGAPEN